MEVDPFSFLLTRPNRNDRLIVRSVWSLLKFFDQFDENDWSRGDILASLVKLA